MPQTFLQRLRGNVFTIRREEGDLP
jgi:hypothetical protein